MAKPVSISLVINAFAVPPYVLPISPCLACCEINMKLTPSQGKRHFSSLYPGTVQSC